MKQQSVVPRYHQIFLVLRQQIEEGLFDEAGLPTEVELAQAYQVGRVTVRRALDELTQGGFIFRKPGIGTFVNVHARRLPVERQNLFDGLVAQSRRTTVEVIAYQRIRLAGMARLLQLASEADILKIVRVRSLGNHPVSLITTYVPGELEPALPSSKLATTPMLTLLREAGIEAQRAEQTITACLADPVAAQRLGIEPAAPLLSVRRLTFDGQGKPVQLLDGLYRPDSYEYRLTLSRMGVDSANVWMPAERSANSLSD